jgi:hypothetical protein
MGKGQEWADEWGGTGEWEWMGRLLKGRARYTQVKRNPIIYRHQLLV